MRKIISFIISTLFLVVLVTPVFAESPISSSTHFTDSGESFTISEYTLDNKQIVRTYKNDGTPSNGISTYSASERNEKTYAILIALGFDQDVIDQLPNNTLDKYSSSSEISTITSYIKEDTQGQISYLSEEEALVELAAIDYAGATDTVTDSYMKLTHTISYQNNALYHFSTTATWLTMPVFRATDSIGSCAPTLSITNSSRYAWCKYTLMTTNLNSGESSTATYTYYPTDFRNAVNGDWYGSACVFNLPNNTTTSDYAQVYSNFKAYYEFEAYLRYPELETYFNSVGTYSHQTYAVNLSPSITIDFDGKTTASISFSLSSGYDDRSVELQMHYDPDISVLSE